MLRGDQFWRICLFTTQTIKKKSYYVQFGQNFSNFCINSFILTKLLYGLDGAEMNQSEKRRLDAFHAKCLRRILKAPHSFYSHVSNEQIWQAAHVQPLSLILFSTQLTLFGNIASMPIAHPDRALVSDCNMPFCKPPTTFPRKVGRPRTTLVDAMHHAMLCICGSPDAFEHIFSESPNSLMSWSNKIKEFVIISSID